MKLEETKTPSLLLDITRVRRNATQMSEVARRNNVRLRPHIKTHKCIEVGRLQTEGHDSAITVSTLAEAKAFAANGFSDITYAVPIERGKFDEAIGILKNGVKLNLLTDDAETSKALDEAAGKAGVKFDVFVKIDCGTHRVGVEPHTPEAVEIPRLLSDARNLNFAGILTHAGHSYNANSKEEILAVARHERDSMVDLAETAAGPEHRCADGQHWFDADDERGRSSRRHRRDTPRQLHFLRCISGDARKLLVRRHRLDRTSGRHTSFA